MLGTPPLPRKSLTLLCVGLVVLALCGCDQDIVPVSGEVLLQGKPLAGAIVTFQPLGQRKAGSPQPAATGSVGRTDALGRYSLRLIHPDRVGAVIGDHAVTISVAPVGKPDAEPPKGQRLSKTWYDGSRRFRVPAGGTDVANFEVTMDAAQTRSAAPQKGKR